MSLIHTNSLCCPLLYMHIMFLLLQLQHRVSPSNCAACLQDTKFAFQVPHSTKTMKTTQKTASITSPPSQYSAAELVHNQMQCCRISCCISRASAAPCCVLPMHTNYFKPGKRKNAHSSCHYKTTPVGCCNKGGLTQPTAHWSTSHHSGTSKCKPIRRMDMAACAASVQWLLFAASVHLQCGALAW